jgi:hypothetical protein
MLNEFLLQGKRLFKVKRKGSIAYDTKYTIILQKQAETHAATSENRLFACRTRPFSFFLVFSRF